MEKPTNCHKNGTQIVDLGVSAVFIGPSNEWTIIFWNISGNGNASHLKPVIMTLLLFYGIYLGNKKSACILDFGIEIKNAAYEFFCHHFILL